jgi:hypothetical protein
MTPETKYGNKQDKITENLYKGEENIKIIFAGCP